MAGRPPISNHWDQKYLNGGTPWDSGLVERELIRGLQAEHIAPCRAFELGCGAGTNAVALAQQGFDVVAADCSPVALDRARASADKAGVHVQFLVADVCRVDDVRNALGPESARFARTFSLLFDRGCYHCARNVDLDGFLETLDWLTAPGAQFLMLCGNSHAQTETGPPRVSEDQIRSELGRLFDIGLIQAFRFEDRRGVPGPLGWSCRMARR